MYTRAAPASLSSCSLKPPVSRPTAGMPARSAASQSHVESPISTAVGLLTGGFSEQELSEAGAVRVYTRLADLLDDLDAVLALARRVGTDATG